VVTTILLILALVCLVFATFNVPGPRGLNLMALGLALWVLTLLIG